MNGKFDLFVRLLPLILAVVVSAVLVWAHTQNGLIHQTPDEKREIAEQAVKDALAPLQEDIREVKAQQAAGILPRADERLRALERKVDEIHEDMKELMKRR